MRTLLVLVAILASLSAPVCAVSTAHLNDYANIPLWTGVGWGLLLTGVGVFFSVWWYYKAHSDTNKSWVRVYHASTLATVGFILAVKNGIDLIPQGEHLRNDGVTVSFVGWVVYSIVFVLSSWMQTNYLQKETVSDKKTIQVHGGEGVIAQAAAMAVFGGSIAIVFAVLSSTAWGRWLWFVVGAVGLYTNVILLVVTYCNSEKSPETLQNWKAFCVIAGVFFVYSLFLIIYAVSDAGGHVGFSAWAENLSYFAGEFVYGSYVMLMIFTESGDIKIVERLAARYSNSKRNY